jgi:hypothetical protein
MCYYDTSESSPQLMILHVVYTSWDHLTVSISLMNIFLYISQVITTTHLKYSLLHTELADPAIKYLDYVTLSHHNIKQSKATL